MEKEEKTLEYQNGDLTIVWKPGKCIHSGICVKGLPNVFQPKERPWVKADQAGVEELKEQIDRCPSGALSYYMKGENAEEPATATTTKVEIMDNGPLLVHGQLQIVHKDGKIIPKNRVTAFCRCGASANKPYCDGSHSSVEFEG